MDHTYLGKHRSLPRPRQLTPPSLCLPFFLELVKVGRGQVPPHRLDFCLAGARHSNPGVGGVTTPPPRGLYRIEQMFIKFLIIYMKGGKC